MTKAQYGSSAPNVPSLLEVLDSHCVRYVLIGSVAAGAYGVDVRPGDLDIAPALDRENLVRLVQALLEIEAALPETKKLGHWEPQPDGERKWISREATPEDLQKRADWSPDPADVSTLDHLFHTRYGNFDIVPELYGGYETLIKRARKVNVYGHEVWVVHVDELLAALTVPRRKKDISRVRKLRKIQRLLDERSLGRY